MSTSIFNQEAAHREFPVCPPIGKYAPVLECHFDKYGNLESYEYVAKKPGDDRHNDSLERLLNICVGLSGKRLSTPSNATYPIFICPYPQHFYVVLLLTIAISADGKVVVSELFQIWGPNNYCKDANSQYLDHAVQEALDLNNEFLKAAVSQSGVHAKVEEELDTSSGWIKTPTP